MSEIITIAANPIAATGGNAYHAFIAYQRTNGSVSQIHGGGKWGPGRTVIDNAFTNLLGYPTFGNLYTKVIDDLPLSKKSQIIGQIHGKDLSGKFAEMQAVAEKFNKAGLNYDMINVNSNSVVATILNETGVPVPPGLESFTLPGFNAVDINSAVANSNLSQCFLAGTMIEMWPIDVFLEPDENGVYNQDEVLAHVWKKPIEEITPEDKVLSYNDTGNLVPGKVKRTFQNQSKSILDFHGMMVTPRHAFYCADGKYKGQHVPILDILRDDGAIRTKEGKIVRASTGCEVGSLGDRIIKATASVQKEDGTWTRTKHGEARLGTRIFLPDGRDMSFLQMATSEGWGFADDGYMIAPMRMAGGRIKQQKFLFPYPYGANFPKPEDYILQRSGTTLEEIYSHQEWDQLHPSQMSAPYNGEAGYSYKNNPVLRASSEPNLPLSMRDLPQYSSMNEKQRKAEEKRKRRAEKRMKLAS